MIILDEQILRQQRELLFRWRIRVRQIGFNIGRAGIQDEEIIPLLLRNKSATFFTRDAGFCDPALCHNHYCLVHLPIDKSEVATYVRRVLRHPQLDTQRKRIGKLIRASRRGLVVWQRNVQGEVHYSWA